MQNAVSRTAAIAANTEVHISHSEKYISLPFAELGFLILFSASSVTTTILFNFLPGFVLYASGTGMLNYRFIDKDSSQKLALRPIFLKKLIHKIMFQNLKRNVWVVWLAEKNKQTKRAACCLAILQIKPIFFSTVACNTFRYQFWMVVSADGSFCAWFTHIWHAVHKGNMHLLHLCTSWATLQLLNTCVASLIFAHAHIRHVSTIVVSTGLILHCFSVEQPGSLAVQMCSAVFYMPCGLGVHGLTAQSQAVGNQALSMLYMNTWGQRIQSPVLKSFLIPQCAGKLASDIP